MALRLLCHPSSSWTADGRRLLRMDSESMAAFVVDVVETLSQMLHTSAHCWRALKITKEKELPAIEKRGVLDDPRFAHAARNLPDFTSPNRCPAIAFCCPPLDGPIYIHLTLQLVCSIFALSWNRSLTANHRSLGNAISKTLKPLRSPQASRNSTRW